MPVWKIVPLFWTFITIAISIRILSCICSAFVPFSVILQILVSSEERCNKSKNTTCKPVNNQSEAISFKFNTNYTLYNGLHKGAYTLLFKEECQQQQIRIFNTSLFLNLSDLFPYPDFSPLYNTDRKIPRILVDL